jgi:hypothetical protein
MKRFPLFKLSESRVTWIILICCIFFPGNLVAVDTIVNHQSGLELWVPDEWNYQKRGDILLLQPPSEVLSLYCYLTELQVATRFSEGLAEELSKIIEQPEVDTESEVRQVNEFFIYEASGIGLRDGEITDWKLHFVAGGRMSLIVVALGNLSRYRGRVENIFQNLKLVEKPPEPEEEEGEATEGEPGSDPEPGRRN